MCVNVYKYKDTQRNVQISSIGAHTHKHTSILTEGKEN